MTEPTDLDGAVSRLEGAVAGWPADDGGSVLVEAHDLRTVLAALREGREALEEIIDIASLSVVGGDEFDRGARAARLEARDIARSALSPTVKGEG